jgi:transposase
VLEFGYTVTAAAEAVDANRVSVQRWLAAYKARGREGISPSPTPGRPCFLSEKDLSKLEKILLKGPIAAGFPNELWTCARVSEVIRATFGIEFHRSHIWRLLQQLGWSPQKPERRAIERDEKGIQKFVKVEWKRIVKKHGKRMPP